MRRTSLKLLALTSLFTVSAIVVASPAIATPNADWAVGASSTTRDQYRSVAYGNGLWVVVNYANEISTSADGRSWQIDTDPSVASHIPAWEHLREIRFAKGVFMIINSNRTSWTSADGIVWGAGTAMPDDDGGDYYNRLAGSDAGFIAVENDYCQGLVAYSSDGQTWDDTSYAFNNECISAAAYGEGTWVVGSEDGSVNTSHNNIASWDTSVNLAQGQSVWDIAYGNGVFLASVINGSGVDVYRSSDGHAWSGPVHISNGSFRYITFGEGHFFLGDNDSSTNRGVISTTDGVTFSDPVPLPHSLTVNGLAYADGQLVAVGIRNAGVPESTPFAYSGELGSVAKDSQGSLANTGGGLQTSLGLGGFAAVGVGALAIGFRRRFRRGA